MRELLLRLLTGWAALKALRPQRSARQPDPATTMEQRLGSSHRAESIVAGLLGLAAVCAFAFTAVYAAGANTQLLGLALGLALLLAAAAAIVAGKAVVRQETAVQERDQLESADATEHVLEITHSGGEGISRRTLLIGAGTAAGAALVTAAATPVASLGPRLDRIHATPWRRGVRLVDDQGRPYSAQQIEIGSFYTALPEGGDTEDLGAGIVVLKLPPELLQLPAGRRGWAPQGILAFSKICTHAACAVSLYRYPTSEQTSAEPALTCPCHYSTFLPGQGGKVAFGPAGRPLPQLPLQIARDGSLRAAGGFDQDIGPSWWDVHRV
ncbi:MAG: Rieske (2Fe-2S) protein [Solirubrobacterales bacterium]|nr:Rieske (2Fe-2S) protein [Solirubrobacterales bacterium]